MGGFGAPILNSCFGSHHLYGLDFCVLETSCSLASLHKPDSISTPLFMETRGLFAKHEAILQMKQYRTEDPSPHLHLPLPLAVMLSRWKGLDPPMLVAPVTQSGKPAGILMNCLVLLTLLGRRQGERETESHTLSLTNAHHHMAVYFIVMVALYQAGWCLLPSATVPDIVSGSRMCIPYQCTKSIAIESLRSQYLSFITKCEIR
jgi:hypothetical protein